MRCFQFSLLSTFAPLYKWTWHFLVSKDQGPERWSKLHTLHLIMQVSFLSFDSRAWYLLSLPLAPADPNIHLPLACLVTQKEASLVPHGQLLLLPLEDKCTPEAVTFILKQWMEMLRHADIYWKHYILQWVHLTFFLTSAGKLVTCEVFWEYIKIKLYKKKNLTFL